MMTFSSRKRTPVFGKNRGAALAAALILLVSLTLIAVTMAYRSTMNELMAANQRDALNAMSVADSGINAGFAEVKANYSDLPQSLCDIADSGGYLVGNGPVSLSGGNYSVTVANCVAGDRALLHSVGNINGAERVAELLLEMTPGGSSSWPTFLASSRIEISGANLVGPNVHIHSNGIDVYGNGTNYIKASGAPNICATASDCSVENAPPGLVSISDPGFMDPKTYELETANPYPWTVTSNAPPIEMPHVYPPDWYEFATIELTADCRVLAGPANGSLSHLTEIWNVSSQGVWNGWSCTGSVWEMKSSSASLYSAFYYIWGNIKISASSPTPWVATFVAAGNIEITCCMLFAPYSQTGDEIADSLFLLAGNDILVTGSPGNIIDGIIAAHGEVKLSGSGAHFRGSVVAEQYVHGAGQEVTENVQTIKNSITYNLINSNVWLEGTGIGLTGSGAPQLKVAAWRELVH